MEAQVGTPSLPEVWTYRTGICTEALRVCVTHVISFAR